MTRNFVCLGMFAFLLSCNESPASGSRQPSSSSCANPFDCQDQGLTSGTSGGTSSSDCPAASSSAGFTSVSVPTVPFANPPAELQRNLDRLNEYRAKAGVEPLVLDQNLSAFAATGSAELASSGNAHGHFANASGSDFSAAGFCGGGAAENQAPGWPAGDLAASIDGALQAMMDEGPGGGHHDNILNPAWGKVGIANAVIDGRLYMTNDFSPKCD